MVIGRDGIGLISVIAINEKITHGLPEKFNDSNDAITNDLADGKQADTLKDDESPVYA